MVDDEILAAVDAVRQRTGACSYGSLATELGHSRSAVRYRIRKLAEQGLVVVTEGRNGTIRRTGTTQITSGALAVLEGTVTFEVKYDPKARRPLRIKVVDSDGAVSH